MKVYHSIEQLAEDVGISERTGWRWAKKGKIQKEISKDGGRVFFLPDATDSDGDDGRARHSDTGRDVTGEEAGRKRYKPAKVSFATVNPSPAVVSQLERTQIAELQADEQEALDRRKGNREHPAVFEMRSQVEAKKLNLELQKLTQQENEEQRANYRRKLIEATKSIVIPPGLRAELPSDILFASLNLIEQSLKKVDLPTLDESVAYVKSIVYMRFWADPDICGIIKPAVIRWMFSDLDRRLHSDYKSYVERGYRGSYSNFLAYIFSTMSPTEQMQITLFAQYGR